MLPQPFLMRFHDEYMRNGIAFPPMGAAGRDSQGSCYCTIFVMALDKGQEAI